MDSEAARVINAFAEHDVVLLGENHGVHQNFEFIKFLLPHLHTNGVYNIAIEFGADELQSEADALVMSDAYSEDVARKLLFQYNVGWPYFDYVNIYRDVWEFNQSLPPSAPPMRIIHASYIYHWGGWNRDRSVAGMQKVFWRGNYNENRARNIMNAVVNGEKVLGIFGAIHALRTEFPAEYAESLKDYVSLGQILNREIPGRVWSILLNHAGIGTWDDHIVNGSLDELTDSRIDEKFLDGVNFEEIVRNWPDPDWTNPPADLDDYWRIVTNRKLA